MNFPETRRELDRMFYKFVNRSKCKACHAPIEWWLTTGKKKMPFDPVPADPDAKATTHRETCPESKSFKGKRAPAIAEAMHPAVDAAVEDVDLERFANRNRCRVVMAIFENGTSRVVSRIDIAAEDVRHEIITAANQYRNRQLSERESA